MTLEYTLQNRMGVKELHGRRKLESCFAEGIAPSSISFNYLIDSSYNLNDEDFNKSVAHGFEVSTKGSYSGLLKFYTAVNKKASTEALSKEMIEDEDLGRDPLWSIKFCDDKKQDITFGVSRSEDQNQRQTNSRSEPLPNMQLSNSGYIGIQTRTPNCELDANGTIRSSTRLGVGSLSPPNNVEARGGIQAQVIADGEWHTISSALTGCQSLQVVAGVGKKGSGRYALVHAIATNAFNPTGWLFNFLKLKNRIRCQQAYYRSRADKLVLRWTGENRRYYLQIKSNGDYGVDSQGEPVRINYHLTKLWSDPRMVQSWNSVRDDLS